MRQALIRSATAAAFVLASCGESLQPDPKTAPEDPEITGETAPEETLEDLPPVPEDSADTGPEPDSAAEVTEPGPPWEAPDAGDLARWVDPFIGTGGSGNTFPGAALPHGLARVGPDALGEEDRVTAFRWGDAQLEGFTHTQLNGPGGSHYGYSEILLMPVLGPDVPTPTSTARSRTRRPRRHPARSR